MHLKRAIAAAALCVPCAWHGWASQQHTVQGMLLDVNPANSTITVSCDAIAGYMEAMVMPFAVRDSEALKAIVPGTTVRFTMVERGHQEFAEHLRTIKYANYESEPTEAARLAILNRAMNLNAPAAAAKIIPIGHQVPDFTLTDQAHQPTHLSQFRGKVVALTFAYSRCPNPNYCFRLSNNLSQLNRRFRGRAAHDLILMTIVIDPDDDQGKALERYADTWKADPATWHFLTGPVSAIQAFAENFGMNFWNDESFLTHSFHTVVIDRDGNLAANIEGNQFTAGQLGDLVETVLKRPAGDANSATDAMGPGH